MEPPEVEDEEDEKEDEENRSLAFHPLLFTRSA